MCCLWTLTVACISYHQISILRILIDVSQPYHTEYELPSLNFQLILCLRSWVRWSLGKHKKGRIEWFRVVKVNEFFSNFSCIFTELSPHLVSTNSSAQPKLIVFLFHLYIPQNRAGDFFHHLSRPLPVCNWIFLRQGIFRISLHSNHSLGVLLIGLFT